MKYFVFRNFTVENLFTGIDAKFSGYGDISFIPEEFDSYIWFYLPSINMNYEELSKEIEDFKKRFDFLLTRIRSDKTIIALTAEVLFEFKTIESESALARALSEYNQFLFDQTNKRQNLKVIDFKEFIGTLSENIFDWRFYYISQSLISPKFNKLFISWFHQKLQALHNKRKKCLILDLDNTLWGGIVGEDGLEGVQLGNTYPGAAFYDFQKGLLELYKSGVILALCSKNNEGDVLNLFSKHPFQLIKKKHLSAYRINWIDKPSNIKSIAAELNIGLDSMVFIDDNPLERERVKFELPMVTVPEFPKQPFSLPQFLKSVKHKYFEIYNLTYEDKLKTKQYQANADRREHSLTFKNIDDYLSSLNMEMRIFRCTDLNISRIAQMTQKTNQFNLTTRRYNENDLKKLQNDEAIINCLSVKDKFGDNGITVASIILIQENTAEIESFLLSCRILGRGIESAYLYFLLNKLHDIGVNTVKATYIPSEKNIQTANFYETHGFEIVDQEKSGLKKYRLDLKEKFILKKYYTFIEE